MPSPYVGQKGTLNQCGEMHQASIIFILLLLRQLTSAVERRCPRVLYGFETDEGRKKNSGLYNDFQFQFSFEILSIKKKTGKKTPPSYLFPVFLPEVTVMPPPLAPPLPLLLLSPSSLHPDALSRCLSRRPQGEGAHDAVSARAGPCDCARTMPPARRRPASVPPSPGMEDAGAGRSSRGGSRTTDQRGLRRD